MFIILFSLTHIHYRFLFNKIKKGGNGYLYNKTEFLLLLLTIIYLGHYGYTLNKSKLLDLLRLEDYSHSIIIYKPFLYLFKKMFSHIDFFLVFHIYLIKFLNLAVQLIEILDDKFYIAFQH